MDTLLKKFSRKRTWLAFFITFSVVTGWFFSLSSVQATNHISSRSTCEAEAGRCEDSCQSGRTQIGSCGSSLQCCKATGDSSGDGTVTPSSIISVSRCEALGATCQRNCASGDTQLAACLNGRFCCKPTVIPTGSTACPGNCFNASACPRGYSGIAGSCGVGGEQVCCQLSATSGGGGVGGGPGDGGGQGGGPGATAPTNISFSNPLQYDTVEEVLDSILDTLRNIIVILSLVFIVIGAILYITSAGNDKQMTMAKGAITAAMIGLAIGLAAPSFLKEIGTVLGWDASVNQDAVAGAQTLSQIARNVLDFLLSIIGVLAIIMLVVGGIMYLTAAGSEDQLDTAKKIVWYSIIGIVTALAALVIVSQIAAFFV